MNPLAIVPVKLLGAAGAAALISVGAAGALADAASPSPSPAPTASAVRPTSDVHADRRAIRRAVVEAEADVLGLQPRTLVADLRAGQKVSDLAKDRGIGEDQFETRLAADLKPRLEALVDRKVITQAQADRVLDRISKGFIAFWNGVHHRK